MSGGLLADLGLQWGGATGDGYTWQRPQRGKKVDKPSANKSESTVRDTKVKRDAWMDEVRSFYNDNHSWKESMTLASNARKTASGSYKTIKETRPREDVNDRQVSPYKKRSHKPLSLEQATKVLRNYYRAQLESGRFNNKKQVRNPSSRAVK